MLMVLEPASLRTLRCKRIGRAAARRRRPCGAATEASDDRHALVNLVALDGGVLAIGHAAANADRRDLARAVDGPEKCRTLARRELTTLSRITAGRRIATRHRCAGRIDSGLGFHLVGRGEA